MTPRNTSTKTTRERSEERRRALGRANGRLLTLRQVEAVYGVSYWTLREMVARGDLPAVRLTDDGGDRRHYWLDRHDLDALIEARKERAIDVPEVGGLL